MYYRYIAYTSDKRIAKGTQAAANEGAAAKILASHGYKVLALRPVPAFLPRWDQIALSRRISAQTIITFSRQLALLHESGIDIVTALEMLVMQTTSRRFRNVLSDLILNIRKGDRLSEAMGKHPNAFSKIYVQSIAVGEQAGGIETILRQIADHIDKEDKASKSVQNAMKYPALVVVVAIAVVATLINVVFPTFATLYSRLNAEVPAITRGTIAAASWLSDNGLYILAAIVIFVIALYVWSRTENGKLRRDRMNLKLPVLGRVVHLNELIRCCRNISILYKAGLPVPEVLLLAIETSNNVVMKQALIDVHQDVLKGEALSRSMSKHPIFLPNMVQMVSVGEATGNLEGTLSATADSYEAEAEIRMRNIIGSIQPIVTVILGVVVAVIAISLVSAMYSLYGQV